MQLNVLDDLAEAMKVLDGKKIQVYETTLKSKPHPKLRLLLFKNLRC